MENPNIWDGMRSSITIMYDMTIKTISNTICKNLFQPCAPVSTERVMPKRNPNIKIIIPARSRISTKAVEAFFELICFSVSIESKIRNFLRNTKGTYFTNIQKKGTDKFI